MRLLSIAPKAIASAISPLAHDFHSISTDNNTFYQFMTNIGNENIGKVQAPYPSASS
jgi:hypothetical protein